jgi:hypothetical protein
MDKSKFIEGDEYTYKNGSTTIFTYLGESKRQSSAGRFENPLGDLFHYQYENMASATAPATVLPSAPKATPCFDAYDKIDICSNDNFREGVVTGEFLYKDPHGTHWIIKSDGYLDSDLFARKVEPKVRISMWGSDGSFVDWEIAKGLADKIRNGEEL